MEFGKCAMIFGATVAAVALSPHGEAQVEQRRTYRLPPQDLKAALRTITREAGLQLIADAGALKNKKANALQGEFTPAEAVALLLKGTNLTAIVKNRTIFIRGRSQPSRDAVAGAAADDLIVTGSRIRGGTVASNAITMSQDMMRNAGLGTLAEAVQTIPQNFSGGQNPGVGFNVPEGTGVGYGAASSINLRGLGSDATLTLLNGHRLAYNFAFQAIDISSIPFEAVDRIEVVPDGSSALYGSDAVAGVANILLKQNYDGLRTTARFGASTKGGNEQQQYGAIAGRNWSSGNLLLSGEFARTTPITARERSYSAGLGPGLYLSPFIKRYSLLASAHQDLSDTISFAVDTLYNRRRSATQYAFDERGDIQAYGSTARFKSQSLVIAPDLTWQLPRGWQANLAAMVGFDRSKYRFDTFIDGTSVFAQVGCYCNTAKSIELNLDGSLFPLPGGRAKLAVGAGYRINKFHGYRTDASQDIRASQDAYFAYAELGMPLISPAQGIGGLHRIDVTGALRYEKYPGVDEVVTPKMGLIYAPIADVDIKATWGKSFRAPTLYQQYNQVFANVYSNTTLGGSTYPADATAILVSGGNPSLKPERANTWSATLDLHPASIPGLRVEISYFNVKYRDRIVTPIQYASQSLSNPLYTEFVNFAPSVGDVDDVLARADVFQNVAPGMFDPAKVAAIVNNGNVNVARQKLNGVDVAAQYAFEPVDWGSFSLRADASFLNSKQIISPSQPVTRLSGTLFNPPRVRGRAGLNWTKDDVGLSLFANYTGALRDTRSTPALKIGPTTTLDGSLRLTSSHPGGVLAGMDLILGVQNIFNRKPPLIKTTYVFDAPYDSTNYSAIGRFVTLSVSKAW